MALRVVRQPRGRRSLTAAAAPVTDPARAFRNTLSGLASRDDWQNEAWDMLAVGELRYYVSWRSSACSRCRLVASDVDPATGLPTGSTENTRFREIVKTIAGGPLGQAQLVKRATQCLTVPGEVWLAIIITGISEDGTPAERWLALSKEEIHRGSHGIELDLPEGERHQFNQATDSLIRVWNPNPRKAAEADSPVRATLDSLQEIVRTTRTIANASKSRLIGNGMVLLPQEINLPATNVPAAADQTGAVAPMTEGTPAMAQQIQDMLWDVASKAWDDEDSMSALIPVIATAPGEQIKNVTHLRLGTDVTDVALKTRNDAISRLAMGLDVNPERLLGLGTSNHWSAWQLADDDVQLHIAPVMETLCSAINEQILGPLLAREGLDPEKYVLWYDPSDLTADPDQTDNATAAFTAGTITAEAYVDLLGLDADALHDFTTLEGWQRWAQDTMSAHPELTTTLAPLAMGPVADMLPELVPQSQPAIDAAPPEEPPADEEPQTENQPPPSEPSPSAYTRDQIRAVLVDREVGRALELAGKRRRTRSDHARLRGIPMHETHRYMPPVTDGDVARLIEGWDAALEADVVARLGIDVEDLRAAVRRLAREQLTMPMVDA